MADRALNVSVLIGVDWIIIESCQYVTYALELELNKDAWKTECLWLVIQLTTCVERFYPIYAFIYRYYALVYSRITKKSQGHVSYKMVT